jgi:hypothetical protein
MSTKTINYELTKPDAATEYYDVNISNANADIIDAQLKANADAASEKIPKNIATASDQVLVSAGSGLWIAKTLTQIRTWLGLGSAAYTNTTAYATATQGTKADGSIQSSIGTAADQVLVSSGVGTWAAKTLTQFRTWLGLGSAAYTESSAYATAAQGTLATNAIPKSLATAASQFLLSSAVGTWVVKTVAEIQLALGLGSAAYTASTAYATAAQGTTADTASANLTTHAADTLKHKQASGITQTGNYANAEGQSTTASGYSSHAEGWSTIASNYCSHAEGYFTTASGYYSHAEGTATNTSIWASHVMGQYNRALAGSTAGYSGTADAFVIGNGASSSALGNAFRVTFAGAAYGLSAYNSSGADYAEFFEWLDGNPNSEDRVGYFVSLDDDKIRKANSSDNDILGIVSGRPSVIGDSYQDDWQGKYITDEWGRIQYHDVAVPAVLDNDGNIIIPEHTEIHPIYNTDWDPTQEYVPREKRKEWAAVGIMGKLLVRDDGTCQVNGYCKSNDNGIATVSTTGLRVMKRISSNIIQVLIK